jgi:hypothetical protein
MTRARCGRCRENAWVDAARCISFLNAHSIFIRVRSLKITSRNESTIVKRCVSFVGFIVMARTHYRQCDVSGGNAPAATIVLKASANQSTTRGNSVRSDTASHRGDNRPLTNSPFSGRPYLESKERVFLRISPVGSH